MLTRLIGAGTTSAELKTGLTESSRAVRQIAHRVANASSPDFPNALRAAQAGEQLDGSESPVDIEQEMVALADEQLRFETANNLLRKVYQQVRASVREG